MAQLISKTLGQNEDILTIYFTEQKILNDAVIKQIGEELMEMTTRAVGDKMLLNFQGVAFMSSAMMGKILLTSKKCKAANIDLRLCSISKDVMEVFKIMRLNKVLKIYDNEEKAIKGFDGGGGWFG